MTESYRTGGWTIESDVRYRSVFVNRNGERRLLLLMHKDPFAMDVNGLSAYGTR
jgi:hypothetical protein